MADAPRRPVAEAPEEPERTDGRRARRDRNRTAVIDVVLEMFRDELLLPTIEEAAKRSGLSLRSVYRYFADPDELLQAAIERNLEQSLDLAHLQAIGQGPLDERIDAFVTTRVNLYQLVGPTYRASTHNASRHPRIRDSLADTRRQLRTQFELQFAPELDRLANSDRHAVVAAGDVLSQLDSIELLRRYRQLTVAETEAAVRRGLSALLAPAP